jgi:hypothetical protein
MTDLEDAVCGLAEAVEHFPAEHPPYTQDKGMMGVKLSFVSAYSIQTLRQSGDT